MTKAYLWQLDGWPKMVWDDNRIGKITAEVNTQRGVLTGRLDMFGFDTRSATILDTMTHEIMNSSAIEGEMLNRDSVRSSVARHLGLETNGGRSNDHYIEGVVEILMDATRNYDTKLTAQRLFGWHAALFPTGYSGPHKIKVGGWRTGDEPMQVVSGAMGHEIVHFEAPGSNLVPPMMKEFLKWVNDDKLPIDPIVKAAVAHLWFVTIHPFDDGNGRICRTITEMLLTKADKNANRYFSLSSTILQHRKEYYEHLENAQKNELDVTDWVEWFLKVALEAVDNSIAKTERVVKKTLFWDSHRDIVMNERQRKVLNMLLDGFEGYLTSSKWYKINHCSQDTANRDINDLISKDILHPSQEGGRSIHYKLVE